MKLRIEVDIDPSEVDLAAELIKTLRTLTDHIKINLNGQKDTPAQAAAYETRAATPLAPAVPVAAAPVQPDFDRPPRSAASSGRSIEQPLANGYAEPSQPATPNLAAFFKDCIARFEQAVDADDQLGQDEAVQQLRSELPAQMTTEDEKVCFSTFMTAFEEALWQHRSTSGSYVVPLCHILPQLPDAVKEESKQHIITKVLRHLMIKRPVTADRTEFFAHAEAFAAMSQLKFVLIEGAVQTIIQLLSKEDTCSAAVTMLGKTVELCYSLLLENCDTRKLGVLRAALNEVKYEDFVYDKQYIMGCMHWNQPADGPPQIPNGHPAPAPAAAASPQKPAAGLLRLEPIASWTGYNAPVKGVVIDETRKQVVSTSQNGSLVLHSFDGRELSRIESKMHYSRDMDYSKEAGIICLASVPHAPDAGQPMYAAYQVEVGKLRPLGTMLSSAKTLGPLRFLANSTSFVASETTSSGEEVINIFDAASIRGPGLPATPTASFKTTHEHITAVAAMPTSTRAFLSGDKHGNVHLWDLGRAEPAAILLPPHYGAGPVEPNVGVITCLEVVGGHFVLAGAYNQGINVWDLRELQNKNKKQLKPCSSIALDDDVVTRMARGPDPMQFAVAAVKSLHTAEIDSDGQVAGKVLGEKASEKFYFDLKWSTGGGQTLLYAASQGNTLDIYRAT